MRERLALVGSVIGASFAIAGGVFASLWTHHSHWMNRAGAAVVVLQIVAVIGEFLRRTRLRNLESFLIQSIDKSARRREATPYAEDHRRAFVRDEIEKSERQALVIVLLLAVVGEVLHGFGDLLFEMVVH